MVMLIRRVRVVAFEGLKIPSWGFQEQGAFEAAKGSLKRPWAIEEETLKKNQALEQVSGKEMKKPSAGEVGDDPLLVGTERLRA